MPPEAPSPRRINISRDISSSDSSQYPPSRYEDLKEAAIRSSTTFINPREAPRVNTFKEEEADLPVMPRAVPGFGGMAAISTQQTVFPVAQQDSSVAGQATRIDVRPQKRAFFASAKAPAAAVSAGKLTIGNPILQDNAGLNPLNKIATMDLKEAAQREQARRAYIQRESGLIASRPPPQPPNMTAEEALKRSVSVKRKEVQSVKMPPRGSTVVNSSLMPQRSDSTSSGAQLSPGVEELRRRSPRMAPERPQRPVSPGPEPQPEPVSKPEPKPETRSATPPEQVTAKLMIRPSRQLPQSPTTPPAEPVKSALQRRPTNGLPSNPRSQGLKVAQAAGAQRQQTVLFVNNIIYDDPKIVQSILDGASSQAHRDAGVESPLNSASVVHRPRPIPRKTEDGHVRNKSSGSMSRKSILMSSPGSPTQLPPLPPPPKPVGISERPQPNDTASMTWDEKMKLFFPAPPSGGSEVTRTVGPLPQIPPLPPMFLDEDSTDSPTYRRNSNRTTKTSIRTEDILEVDELPQRDPMPAPNSSSNAYQNDIGRSWSPDTVDFDEDEADVDIASDRQSSKQFTGGGKRGSSPVLPYRSSAWTESTAQDDVATTNWGSVHSPQLAVAATGQVVKTADFKKNERSIALPVSERKNVPSMLDGRGSEVMTVMLAAPVDQDPIQRGSWLLDDDSVIDPQRLSGSWHRRVGDDCPSFSDRKERVRSRKMPPPTPLLLNTKSASKTAMLIQAAEPSPVESPEHALHMIQAQLKKFEQPNRESVESQGQRIALLENLEKEMGMQEEHWQDLKHDLGRDSMSSVQTTSPARNSRVEPVAAVVPLSRESSTRSNIGLERRASRRAKLRTSTGIKMSDELSPSPVAIGAAGGWRQRLAEAQMEYRGNATELLKKRSMNFLTISKDLGSPTPPDSDESDGEIAHARTNIDAFLVRELPRRASLWTPAAPVSSAPRSLMWSRPPQPARKLDVELPSLSVRPAQRKESAPLRIQSSQLWRKPYGSPHRNNGGLWRPAWASAAPPAAPIRASQTTREAQPQKAVPPPRPLTQRPPRRSKRVTLLPDIIENPEPLPDKRGTLGIFQFPWGERSDTASIIQPRPTMYMAMPGTMTSGGPSISTTLDARSRQLEQSEYSSSFFDDYDDEDDEAGRGSDYEDGESDDGFDETTLWEIASLLKSDSVPSKDSLFPPPVTGSVTDDYMNEIPSDDEGGSSREQSIMIGLAEEQEDIFFEQPANARESQPWAAEPSEEKPSRIRGLPHPSDKTWATHSTVAGTSGVKPHKAAAAIVAPAIESTTLQAPEAGAAANPIEKSPMWAGQQKPSLIPRPTAASSEADAPAPEPTTEHKPSMIPRLTANSGEIKKARRNRKQVSMGLWDAPADAKDPEVGGLFALGARRGDIRTTSQEPAAQLMLRKNRLAQNQPLARLSSAGMWDKDNNAKTISRETSHGMWSQSLSRRSEEPAGSGMFNFNRARQTIRTTSQEPAAKIMERRPRQSEKKPLDMLESTALWAPDASGPSEHDWMSGKVTPSAGIPSPLRYRRPVAYRSDWEAALKQAITASYPTSSAARRASTPAEWAEALDEALAQSGLKTVSFNPAVRHPVFATSYLATQSDWFHPAATGYTRQAASEQQQELKHAEHGIQRDESHLVQEQLFSHNAMIQAQIEALEQEKIFVAQAAQQDYHRRTSMAMQIEALEQEQRRLVREEHESKAPQSQLYSAPQQTFVEEPRTILDLQRQMEAHARQRASTVWYDPISAQSYVADAPEEEPIPIGMAIDTPAASQAASSEPQSVEHIALADAPTPAQTWNNQAGGVQLRY